MGMDMCHFTMALMLVLAVVVIMTAFVLFLLLMLVMSMLMRTILVSVLLLFGRLVFYFLRIMLMSARPIAVVVFMGMIVMLF